MLSISQLFPVLPFRNYAYMFVQAITNRPDLGYFGDLLGRSANDGVILTREAAIDRTAVDCKNVAGFP